MRIRTERADDIAAVRNVNQHAFGTSEEAAIVDLVRAQAQPIISLVAEDDDTIVGHILFSPVTVEGTTDRLIMGLAPMAVLPDRQRQGIGTALAREGLEQCRRLGAVGVVVVGHPEFYPRFGFAPASRLGLRCEFEVPDDAFMAAEFVEGALHLPGGMIRYHPAFSATQP
jgi:putative acetyltransferase